MMWECSYNKLNACVWEGSAAKLTGIMAVCVSIDAGFTDRWWYMSLLIAWINLYPDMDK